MSESKRKCFAGQFLGNSCRVSAPRSEDGQVLDSRGASVSSGVVAAWATHQPQADKRLMLNWALRAGRLSNTMGTGFCVNCPEQALQLDGKSDFQYRSGQPLYV